MSKHLDLDCTRRCRSRNHGQAITSAITKRLVSDAALASFIKATCANFKQAFDFEGRTALHMTSSRGRLHLTDWLVRHSSEAFINAKDRESGYTPLHRSIFYGQIHIAVALMKLGANMDILDKDGYTTLEHAMLDRQYMYEHEDPYPCDVYVWGSNCNYTLGTGTQQPRTVPELLSCFSRANASVQQVCLGKFHSAWLCDGLVYVCGQAGRVGAAHGTILRPAPVRLPEPVRHVALLLDSTVLMLQSGAVLQYTLNRTDTSPITKSSTLKLPSTKPVLRLSEPRGLCAGRSHVVVWDELAVYTWGTNCGQLGHSQNEKMVPAPKRVEICINNKEGATYQLASASDAATAFTTSRGDVYLLHNYICKKIAIKLINLRQVCVEAKVSEQGTYSRVTVLLLTTVGKLLLWQDTTNKLTRCVFGVTHPINIIHMALSHDALYFTTKTGEAFTGYISRKTTPTAPQPIRKEKERDSHKSGLVKFLEKDDCTSVRIVKITNVHRAVSVVVDNEGLNFACLQIKPACGLTSLPDLSPTSWCKHMETLMETAADDDILHDVIFKVGGKLFPAHIFIIASSSEHLYKLYQDYSKSAEEKPVVALDMHPEVFARILRYMYTGSCDVAELGPCGLKIRREDLNSLKKADMEIDVEDSNLIENASEISAFEAYKKQDNRSRKSRRSGETPPRQNLYCDPVKLVQAAAKRLHVMGLHKLLDKFFYKDGTICLKENATYTKNTLLQWDRSSHQELVDTTVVTKDGELIPAHKCVLAARLDYFHGMFMHSWSESRLSSKVTLPINHGILLPVIDFLYTDSCPEVTNSDSIDFICSVLVVADQLFITRLREMCEVALSGLVSLKNCAEVCQFAHTYNATQLKECCMQFISLNLCNLLENKSLEALELALLEDITKYYCKFNPIMASRVITPFFNAPDDEIINELAKNHPVDLDATDEDLKKDDSLVEINKKKKLKKIEYSENEKTRMRYESVSSVNSLDLTNDTSGDVTLSLSKISLEKGKSSKDKNKWIEVPSSQQKQQKVVQARLKALSSAKDILTETPVESFTKLTSNSSSSAINTPSNTPSTSRMSVSPKESPKAESVWGSPGNLVINHVGPKLSQKQRKKLAMQGNHPQSLYQYLDSKEVGSPPDKPKNPWKIVEAPVASSSPKQSKAMEFNQILADQKKQKDDSSRIMTKPLYLTQLEDKAIEELERFYNVHELDDEFITVRRIELQVSAPQWPHAAPK